MSKTSKSYADKLRDPRWQKLRLQVLERDQWKCRQCEETERTLHVHHGHYARGAEPWEADPATLFTLCEECHEEVQGKLDSVKEAIGHLDPALLDAGLLGFLQTLVAMQGGPGGEWLGECLAAFDRLLESCRRESREDWARSATYEVVRWAGLLADGRERQRERVEALYRKTEERSASQAQAEQGA